MNGDTQPAWAGKTPANQIGANGANTARITAISLLRNIPAGPWRGD
jgi:hypothetical protein